MRAFFEIFAQYVNTLKKIVDADHNLQQRDQDLFCSANECDIVKELLTFSCEKISGQLNNTC